MSSVILSGRSSGTFSPKYSSPLDFGIHQAFYEFAQSIYNVPGLYESVVERFLPFAKQQESEDAFARRRGYSILEMPTGQGLIVKR